MVNNNILVIGGGVGPEAGTLFHQKIIKMTDNGNDGDQGHVHVLHTSFSPFIADRTKFIKSGSGVNPGTAMAIGIKLATQNFEVFGGNLIVGVPCNTFHAPAVYGAFINHLPTTAYVPINMIDLTVEYFKSKLKENETIILLSTEGTKKSGVYSSKFLDNHIEIVECGEESMAQVMAGIYDNQKGIKSGGADYDWAVDHFEAAISMTCNKLELDPLRCHVIMGCTEIPLAYEKCSPERSNNLIISKDRYVDPMDILAANMIVAGGYNITSSNIHLINFSNQSNAKKRRLTSNL